MKRLPHRLAALILLAGLVAAIGIYPAPKAVLAAAALAWMALLWWRPALWLLGVPALLPVLDVTPWTGSFYLEELDLLLLATGAVGYWRIGADSRPAELPRPFAAALGLVLLATAIAAYIGFMPPAALDANTFAGYASRYNSLRVAKGFAWALVLLPLLRHSAGPDLARLERYFVPGMLLGLAGTALAVIWERAAFPGLFNFASDYRPTAPFSAMHTGGAALDAYLALSFPFVAAWLIRGHGRRRLGAALLLMLLGCYAGLATFSRDVYLAYAVSGAVLGALLGVQRLRRGAVDRRALFAGTAALVACALVLTRVFAGSGYRGLAAALALVVAAVLLGSNGQRLRRAPLVAAGALLLVLLDLAVYALAGSLTGAASGLASGPYLTFLLAAALFAAGAARLLSGAAGAREAGLALAAAAFPALALSSALVAYGWGGAGALPGAAAAVALALALVACNRLPARPLWRAGRATLTVAGAAAIVFAIAIPLAGSYYLGQRFSTTGNDMQVRVDHWSEALGMMDTDWRTTVFGMGLGRFPDTYFWNNGHGETPARLSYETEGSNQFLRLVSGSYAAGYGETLRVLQHVALVPGRRYLLSFDARRTSPKATLRAMVCERWLLYPQNCLAPKLALAPPDGAWHHYALELPVAPWRAQLVRPTTQLELANGGVGGATALDVDNVSLQAAISGSELVRNGAFSYGNDGWFFSSDRNHMPWHVKNFAVNMFFEQGLVGSAAMALLLLVTAGALARRGLHGDTLAAVSLAGLAGMMVVGLFDSLVDVPRLTLVLLLVLAAAQLRPARQRVRRARARPQAAADLIA